MTSHPILGCPKNGDGSTPKIIVYGQSIGGAVALDLAARNPQIVAALILENTFLSMVSCRSSASSLTTYIIFMV